MANLSFRLKVAYNWQKTHNTPHGIDPTWITDARQMESNYHQLLSDLRQVTREIKALQTHKPPDDQL